MENRNRHRHSKPRVASETRIQVRRHPNAERGALNSQPTGRQRHTTGKRAIQKTVTAKTQRRTGATGKSEFRRSEAATPPNPTQRAEASQRIHFGRERRGNAREYIHTIPGYSTGVKNNTKGNNTGVKNNTKIQRYKEQPSQRTSKPREKRRRQNHPKAIRGPRPTSRAGQRARAERTRQPTGCNGAQSCRNQTLTGSRCPTPITVTHFRTYGQAFNVTRLYIAMWMSKERGR